MFLHDLLYQGRDCDDVSCVEDVVGCSEFFGRLLESHFGTANDNYFLALGDDVFGYGLKELAVFQSIRRRIPRNTFPIPPPPPKTIAQMNESVLGANLRF